MAKVQNGEEILRKISRAHKRYRRQMDLR